MSEVHLKVSPDPFNRRIEIAVFQSGKFIAKKFHQLFYTHAFAGFNYTDLAEIPVRIYIEISPLYHLQAGFFNQFSQRFIFGEAIRHAGKNKIVDRGPATK